jgi:hypothetical protein
MAIVKIQKTENYSTINNFFPNDTRLSWRARGVLVYLLSKPNNWEVRFSDLASKSDKDGVVIVRNVFKELTALGYAKLSRGRINGKFGSFYTIFEFPSNSPHMHDSTL